MINNRVEGRSDGQDDVLSTIAISNTTTQATTTREFSGEWWLPDKPTKRVGGILRFDSEAGGLLDLLGTLTNSDDFESDLVIFGQAGGQLVTVPRGFLLGSTSTFLPGAEQTSQRWKCDRVLVGDHIREGDSAKFSMFTVTTHNLSRWTSRPIPKIEESDDNVVKVSIPLPPPLVAHLEHDLTLTLRWSQRQRHSFMSIDVSVEACLDISSSPMTLDEFYDDILNPILILLALCTSAPDRLAQLWIDLADRTAEAFPKVLQVLSTSWISAFTPESKIDSGQFLIRFEDVEDRFQDFLQRWLTTYRNLRRSLLDFFSVLLTRGMYIDESFLRTIRSLESWHRDRFPDEKSKDEIDLDRILNSLNKLVPSTDISLLKSKLEFAHEPSLRQRLDSLVDSSPNPIIELLKPYKNFSKRCVATRNSLVHHVRRDDAFKDVEMYWAERTLRHILTGNLLTELHLPPAIISQCLSRAREWANLNSTYNVLRTSPKK